MEAWTVVLPEAWLSNKQLAPIPGPRSLLWTLEGSAYFASVPLNVTVMLCRNVALMKFVCLQTGGTAKHFEIVSSFYSIYVFLSTLGC